MKRKRYSRKFQRMAVEPMRTCEDVKELAKELGVTQRMQCASGEYVAILEKHGIVPSMSRPANPHDNATCESFIKTLKYEEVYRTEYRDLAEARTGIGAFLDKVYNRKRLHSALGYLPPAEFERGAWKWGSNAPRAAARLLWPSPKDIERCV